MRPRSELAAGHPARAGRYLAAGVAPPAPAIVPRRVGPGVLRILDRLVDTPVAVFTVSWDQVLANPMWQARFADHEERAGREANLIWRFFADNWSRIARTSANCYRFARTMVSDLHDAAARYPEDPELAGLIRDLRVISAWFAELWDTYVVVRQISERKTSVSPAIGTVILDCDVLTVPDSDLRIVVYTASPGSDDAGQLDRLRVAGLGVS